MMPKSVNSTSDCATTPALPTPSIAVPSNCTNSGPVAAPASTSRQFSRKSSLWSMDFDTVKVLSYTAAPG